jgi:hypothetical protein
MFNWQMPETPDPVDFTEIDDEALDDLICLAHDATENPDYHRRVRNRAQGALRLLQQERRWREAQDDYE